MIRVWYDPDCDEVWISDQERSYARRSLVAGRTNGNLTAMLKGDEGGSFVINTPWANVAGQDGQPFADQATALAYLQGEFGKRRLADTLSESYTAVVDLGGHRVVCAVPGGVDLASSDDAASAGAVIGLTTAAATAGTPVPVVTHGPVTEPSWSFAIGPVYLGRDGLLTQDPPTAGCVLRIGRATAPTVLLVDLDEPYFLAA